MGCWKMSKMKFLRPYKAQKFEKQKCIQFWWTPCSNMGAETFPSFIFNDKVGLKFWKKYGGGMIGPPMKAARVLMLGNQG